MSSPLKVMTFVRDLVTDVHGDASIKQNEKHCFIIAFDQREHKFVAVDTHEITTGM